MTEAEIYIETMRRLFPSIYYDRRQCVDHILGGKGTGYYWLDGRIADYEARIPSDKRADFGQTKQAVLTGTAPTVEECLRKHHLNHVEKTEQERHDRIPEYVMDVQRSFDFHMNLTTEQSTMPMVYRVSEGEYGGPIACIPDNITPDWLAIVVEYLNKVLEAKTDFDQKSILTPSDRQYFLGDKAEGLTEEQRSQRSRLAQEISKKLAESMGKTYVPLTDEEKRKNQEEWEKFYSPRARAEQANAENGNSKKAAANIIENLKSRGLYPIQQVA